MRKLSLVIAGVLGAGYPLISQAATLGQAQVQSYLSEPLQVHVPLMRASDEPLDEITVQLASPSFYQQAGVPLADLGSNLTFAIRSEGGQEYVLIGSKRPIRDPILSILLQVDSPQGRMIRSYNLLLDPPSITTASATVSTSGPATRTAPVDKPTAASAWQPVKPAKGVSFEATRQVAQGDTLYKIAQDYVRQGDDVRSWMQAIIDANPQAFANGNGNLLMAGAELKVPSDKIANDKDPGDDVLGATSANETSEAESAIAQSDVIRTLPALPALELLSPSDEASADAEGLNSADNQSLQSAMAETKAALEAAEAKAALDQEELQSVKAENETLTTQLLGLRDQVASIALAVDERDSRIAELKEAVEVANAAQDDFWFRWGKYLTGALGLLVLALLIALGLRRSRQDEKESSLSMAAPAISPTSPGTKEPVATSHDAADSATGSGVVAGAITAGTVTAALGHDEAPVEKSGDVDDLMSPEMALEEARVLESFNLVPQAIELLRDNLTEHPDHAGLQAALDRLEGEERGDGDAVDKDFTDTEEPVSEVEATDASKVVIGDAEGGELGHDIFTGTDVEVSADESSQPQEFEEISEGISWDDDLDDMLTTSTTEPEREADDTLMEFDDSFALETPTEERSSVESSADELPDTATTAHEAQETVSEDDLEPLDLDLTGYEPAGESIEQFDELPSSGTLEQAPSLDDLEFELTEAPANEGLETVPEVSAEQAPAEEAADLDTRVGLAEAFLDIGDQESFDMIEAELREEGATAALQRLDELRKRDTG